PAPPVMPTAEQLATQQLRASLAQEFFDFLVPAKDWHSVEEVAGYIGMRTSFVYELIEAGKLDAHSHNGARTISGREEYKRRRRIHRSAVIEYLLRTANYEPADYVARLCGLIDRLQPTAATLVAEHAVRHRNRMLSR